MGANFVCCCCMEYDTIESLSDHQKDCTQAQIYGEHEKLQDEVEKLNSEISRWMKVATARLERLNKLQTVMERLKGQAIVIRAVDAERKLKTAELQIGELKAALHRGKTGLAAGLAAINHEVKGRRWICDGRGSYAYDNERCRQETGWALDAIEKIATDALSASGELANSVLIRNTNDKCAVMTTIEGLTKVPCGRPLPCGFHGPKEVDNGNDNTSKA